MGLNSNILQTLLSRILLKQVLPGYFCTKDEEACWGNISASYQDKKVNANPLDYKFPYRLLHTCIAKLIDRPRVCEHVVAWAKLLLRDQINQEHVYENSEEETKYEHIIQLISERDPDSLGGKCKYRYIDGGAKLDIFYSSSRAVKVYQTFLLQPVQIEWNRPK